MGQLLKSIIFYDTDFNTPLLNFIRSSFNFLVKVSPVIESSRAGSTTIFKALSDYIWGDSFCLGLCLISTACEGVAIVSLTCKFIPYRKIVWLSSKAVSQSLMRDRNLCAGEGC